MKVLSSVFLVSGLLSSAAFAQSASNARQNLAKLNSFIGGYSSTGVAQDGRACKLEAQVVTVGDSESLWVRVVSGDEDNFKVLTRIYSANADKLKATTSQIKVLDYGWEGESTFLKLNRTEQTLTVKAVYEASEYMGSGTDLDICTFQKK